MLVAFMAPHIAIFGPNLPNNTPVHLHIVQGNKTNPFNIINYTQLLILHP